MKYNFTRNIKYKLDMRLNSTFVSYAAEFSLLTIVTFQKEIKRDIGHMQISSDASDSDLP